MSFTITKDDFTDEIEAVSYLDLALDTDRPDFPESVILFDSRYDYGDVGRQIEPIWISSEAAMALEEIGVLLLVGRKEHGVPMPVDVEGSQVFMYAVQA